ncbi:MAG: hypothetical protein ABFD25_20270 [Clostridiaceae bacterium]
MVENSVVIKVLENYGLDNFLELIPIVNGIANTSYIIKCIEGNLVLRCRSPQYSSDIQMLYEEEYLNYVFHRGINVPVPYKNIPDEVYYSLPKLVMHGDYHPVNVKYQDGKVS